MSCQVIVVCLSPGACWGRIQLLCRRCYAKW